MPAKAKKPQKKYSKPKLWIAGLVLLAALIAAAFLYLRNASTSMPLVPLAQNPTSPTALQCAEKLPTAELAGQVLMIGLPADGMTAQAPIFKQYHVGGAVIMTSPADPYDGGIKLFKTRAGNRGVPLLISTDEEGGIVQRFQTLGALPAPADVASRYSPEQAEKLIAEHGAKLKSIGIDMVLGPLADVAPARGGSPLGSRVFSADPQTVSSYDKAYVRGWQAAGLLPTLKHFPGLGSATGNTDYQPATTPPLRDLEQRDFIPYEGLANSGVVVMVGSQNVPDWFSGPASLSPVVNQYLRQNLGYKNNLIVTDSLAANAVTNTISVSNAVVKAVAAGNDIALVVDPDVGRITAAENAAIIKSAETALKEAVAKGLISKRQLAQSVTRKLAAQRLSACGLVNDRQLNT